MDFRLEYIPPTAPALKPQVRFAPGLFEKMRFSVGAMPPETYAILSGSLSDPLRVLDFHPMAPPDDARGIYRNSMGTVMLDAKRIEYYANTCLYPFDREILGIAHSHPGDMNSLSNGLPGSGQGDIPSMRAQLERAARYGTPWHNFIAPIITRPGPDPVVTTWIVRLDTPHPILAETIWEKEEPAPEPSLDSELVDLLLARPDLVNELLRRDRLINSPLRIHQKRALRLVQLLHGAHKRRSGR